MPRDLTVDAPPPSRRSPDRASATEREGFLAACRRHGVDEARADAIWGELHPETVAEAAPPSQTPLAAIVVGTVFVTGANFYWAQRLESLGGSAALLAFGLAWVVVLAGFALHSERRGRNRLAAGAAALAAAYAPLALAAGSDLLFGDFGDHWWVRAPAELGTIALAALVVRRYREPLITMLPLTAAFGALVIDLALFVVTADDATVWSAAILLAVAAALVVVVLTLDHRGERDWAFWPALLADVLTLAGTVALAAALDARTLIVGLAVMGAAASIAVRGLIAERYVQIAVGAGAFWAGALVATSPYGATATAATLSLAGISLAAAAAIIVRRRREADRD